MKNIIKTTIKLLLRNKGFLFFLLITPILSTFLLGMNVEFSVYREKETGQIIELESCAERALYKAEQGTFIVKVYDGAKTELSEHILRRIAANSMFSVCRADAKGMTYDEIYSRAKKDAFDDRTGMIMYLKEDIDSAVLNDSPADGIELFGVSDDERRELFTEELTDILSKTFRAGSVCGRDTAKTIAMLDEIYGHLPKKNVTDLAGRDEIVLTQQQSNNEAQIGYAFALITLGFVFCGVYAAHTVITEDNNKVSTRIMLSGMTSAKYFISKFIVVILMCALQTGILAVSLCFVKGLDIGIPLPLFLLIVFLLGLIFATLSMLTGILFGDIMSSNYFAYTLWTISAMLSGLLFPIDDTSATMKALSYLMPQKWFIIASKRIIAGLSGGFPIITYATAAYLIIIISIGSVGLKIKKQES